jgi:digalactosyldiacylglycerol synthase
VGNGDPAPPASSKGMFDKGAYFIGKAVWGKGYGTLLQRMKEAKDAGSSFQLDCFGSGEDDAEVPCG